MKKCKISHTCQPFFKIEISNLNQNKEEFFLIKKGFFLEIRFSNNLKKDSFGEKRLRGGGVGWVGQITGTSGY
jgi:hypothetical protein